MGSPGRSGALHPAGLVSSPQLVAGAQSPLPALTLGEGPTCAPYPGLPSALQFVHNLS